MAIINQPFQGQLGNILTDAMKQNYNTFTFFSAFAKNSGVLRMKPALEDFKARGGRISAFIGIDLDGTSYEALLNLYHLCDELYVIHSENLSTTFHSKMYILTNSANTWCAVGSNNFTGGGLWTNFESCSIQEYNNEKDANEIFYLEEIIKKYMDSGYPCSIRISSTGIIETLLDRYYITKEASQKVAKTTRYVNGRKKQNGTPLFGQETISIPAIIQVDGVKGDNLGSIDLVDYTITQAREIVPAFTNEQFWFEMRESTGGSRNILDLSKLGKIEFGSVDGTPYEYTDSAHMYGGIKFFGIDPDDTSVTKNITINYEGKDYFPSTIKFASHNGSWRIQLKGSPNDGSDELSKFGNRGDFVHKILVFEKISTEYYVLSLLEESELEHIKQISRVWAKNGSNNSSKAYGML